MMHVLMVVGPSPTVVVSLAPRLWWQARHQRTLRTLTRLLPREGVIEIQDVRDDGSRMLVRVDFRQGQWAGRR